MDGLCSLISLIFVGWAAVAGAKFAINAVKRRHLEEEQARQEAEEAKRPRKRRGVGRRRTKPPP